MNDSSGGHRLLRHSSKFDEIVKIFKDMIEEDGVNIRGHLNDDCPECTSFLDNLEKQSEEARKDFDKRYPDPNPLHPRYT